MKDKLNPSASGTGGWADRLGLDGRVLLFPLVVPPVLLGLILAVEHFPRHGVPLSRTAAEGLAFMLVVSVIAGFFSLVAGLPAWVAGWWLARRSGLRHHAAHVIAAGVGALTGVMGFHLALLARYGIDAQALWSALTVAALAAALSMGLAAVIYKERRADAAKGAE